MERIRDYFIKVNSLSSKALSYEPNSIINIFIYIGLILHFLYFLFFFSLRIDIMIYVNFISCSVYILALIINSKGYTSISGAIVTAEVITYAVVSTSLCGRELSGQWFIITAILPHYIFLGTSPKQRNFWSLCGMIGLNFITYYLSNFGSQYAELIPSYFMYINLNCFAVLLLMEINLVAIIEKLTKEDYQTSLESAVKTSLVDPLTQLWNRRYLENLEPEILKQVHNGAMISVGILDIDNFKQVNDNYGHKFGDEVLKVLSSSMIKNFRTSDNVIRYGGEEFLIIMKEMNEEHAAKRIDLFRMHFTQREFVVDENTTITITFTCGVCQMVKNESLDKCLHKADERLYLGKGLGKNRIVYKDE